MNYAIIVGYISLIAGFILALVEMLIPGFGLPGITSAICFIFSIWVISDSVESAMLLAIVIVVTLAVLLTICLLVLRKKTDSAIILNEQMRPEQGKIGNEDLTFLIGREGVAGSDLRPAGTAKFDGVEFDVRAEGHFVEKGTPIYITRVSGNTLCVRAKEN